MNNYAKSDVIDKAVDSIRSGEFPNASQAAAHFGCDRTSISKRLKGQTCHKAHADSIGRQCLTDLQERELIRRINYLSERQMPPTSRIVRNLAEELRGESVGKNWVGQFVARYKSELKSMYLRNIDNLRVAAEYEPMFQLFYDNLERTIEKYQITADNIYNFDEKGFLIGIGRKMKRIISQQAINKLGGMKNRQDGNREFISCLACISAIGKAIPHFLIYKGSNHQLQSSWLENVNKDSNTYFASSENGWSSNKLGIEWLEKVFNRHTQPASPRSRRLLIVDGHSSHVNYEFVEWADRHRIIILILPPHSTHKLQPLDVGLFGPLATAYSVRLDMLLAGSGGLTTMSKSMFFDLFKPSFDEVFSEKNIQHAFQKPGIWPVNREDMINSVRRIKKPIAERVPNTISTPTNSRTVRLALKAYQQNPGEDVIQKVFKGLETAIAKADIAEHENKGLREAIIYEKSKRKRGRKLDLSGEPDQGTIVYSPAKVERIKEYQLGKENKAKAIEDQKKARKVQIELNKAIKVKKVEEKEARLAEAQLQKEEADQNFPRLQSLAKKSLSTTITPNLASQKMTKPQKASIKAPSTSKPRMKAQNQVVDKEVVVEEVVRKNRVGRAIKLPLRFQESSPL